MSPPQVMIDFVNYYGSIVSLIVGLLSIWLSVMFYRAAKSSEVESAKLLKSIEKSVDTLSVINNELLSKALQHLASSNSQMIDIIGQYKQNINQAAMSMATETPDSPAKNVRSDILNAIATLSAASGNAYSVKLFEYLQKSYDFNVILYELINMARENLITWDGAPNAPEALSAIKIVQT